MAQPTPNDADVVEMLPAVLRHLADLRKDPDLAESVFTALRIQALRQTPVLPAKARILARVAALAISAPNRVVSDVCAAACAGLVSCLARTDSAAKAACFLHGLCDALAAIREGVRRGTRNTPIDFLNIFERDFVEDFPADTDAPRVDSAEALPRPRSPPESKLDILPRRTALRATIALVRRAVAAPDALAGGDELSAAEQRYARHMWEAVGEDVCNAVAFALSHPALLAGAHGAQVATDAARALHEYVLVVPQSSHAFMCVQERVSVAFESHIHSANGQMTPIRSRLVVRLLSILRLIAGPRGLCPRLWARVGVAAVMRGSPEVAAAATDVVRDGFIANLAADEIVDSIDPFPERTKTAENALEGSRNTAMTQPNGSGGGEAHNSFVPSLNFSNSNSNLTIDSGSGPESKHTTSEKLILAALVSELKNVPDATHMRHAQHLERLCFIVAARAGLWRTSCSYASWSSIANRLLYIIVSTLKCRDERKKAFSLARAALEVLYLLIREAPGARDQSVDGELTCDMTDESFPYRSSQVSKNELNLWGDVVKAVIDELAWVLNEPSDTLQSVDAEQIPKVIQLLAQFIKEFTLFRFVLPSDMKSTLFSLCTDLIEKLSGAVQEEGQRITLTYLLSSYSSMRMICPENMIVHCRDQVVRLSQLVSSFKQISIPLSRAAINAMASSVCISSRCQGDHSLLLSSRPRLVADQHLWECCFEVVEPILKSSENDELIGAAARCLESLSIHTPARKSAQSMSTLVQCVFHPTCLPARRNAMRGVEFISLQEPTQAALDPEHRGTQVGVPLENDGADNTEIPSIEKLVSKLLYTELEEQIENSSLRADQSNAAANCSTDSIIDQDPRILSLIARLCVSDAPVKKTAAIALNALIGGAIADFKNAGAICEPNSEERGKYYKFWSELIFLASQTQYLGSSVYMECEREDKSFTEQRWLVSSMENPSIPSFTPFSSNSLDPVIDLASFLGSRMKDWLPLRLERMLADPKSSEIIAWMVMESEQRLWKNAARYALGSVLRNRKLEILAALSERVKIPKKRLVDLVCADVIAQNALTSPIGIDLRSDGCNMLITEVTKRPLSEIVPSKAGKIMLRLVMELGGENDSAAMHAIGSLARISSDSQGRQPGAHMSHGELISQHFLLVMDAVDRVLLNVNESSSNKLRHLDMLQRVFRLAKHNLRMYVPKVFATLKRCLAESESGGLVKAKTVDVWATLLISLGAQNIAPHLGSMLAHLLPHVPKHAEKIVPVLHELFETGKEDLSKVLPEILLLFRTVTHNSLREISSLLEKQILDKSNAPGDDMDVIVVDKALDTTAGHMPTAEYHTEFERFSSTCLQFLNVATRHESTEIRSIALGQLLVTLRTNRHHSQMLLTSLSDSEDIENGLTPVLATFAIYLTSLVAESKDGCDIKALQCLGELGAIDPVLVLPHTKKCIKQRESQRGSIHKYPCGFLSLGRHILQVHLAPALWRSDPKDELGTRLNRVGLAIQELLKACGCGRQTVEKARNFGDQSGSRQDRSKAPAGILFWNDLSEAIQTAAQPYLLEPFNVSTYAAVMGKGKKFDIQAACTPIWSSMQANWKSVSFIDWRRQLVAQTVDFIGGDGNLGRLFSAVRPALRIEHGVVSAIFPHVLVMALDCEARNLQGNAFCDFLVTELSFALSSLGAAAQGVLSLLDVLRAWRDERTRRLSKKKFIELKQQIKAGLVRRDSASSKKTANSLWEDEKRVDPLSPLVDIEGRQHLRVSLLVQASAALTSHSYPMSVFLAEQHVRNLRFKQGNYTWPAFMSRLLRVDDMSKKFNSIDNRTADERCAEQEEKSLRILQQSYAALEDADSLQGVAALRKSSTLEETIVDAEASGDYDEALFTYERVLKDNSGKDNLHSGFLRCLCTLGHWETMLAHATGLASSTSVKGNSASLQKSARSLGIEAAWRLGRWEQLDELCKSDVSVLKISESSIGSNSAFEFVGEAVGRTLLSVHQKDWEIADDAVKHARTVLLPHVAHAASEGYARAYPLLVHLHILADVEDLVDFTRRRETVNQSQIGATEGNDFELTRMDCRSSAASMSLKVREPMLSVRRACLEMLGYRSLAAHVSIELAQLARESGNLRAATAAAAHALSNTDHDDAVSFASATEMAHILRARGDHSGSLLRLKKVIDEMTRTYEAVKSGEPAKAVGRVLGGLSRGSTSINDIKKRLCAAHVLAGHWIEESRSESSEVVLWHYAQATQYCPTGDQAFYALGRHYDSLWQAASAAERGRTDNRYLRSSIGASTSAFDRTSTKIRRNHYEYVPLIITNFSKALQNGHTRLFEALPRLLTVWFDFYSKHSEASNNEAAVHGVEPVVRRAADSTFTNIPVFMWMSVVPQLMSRILHSSPVIRNDLSVLLARLLRQFPNQGVWLIAASSQLRSAKRREAVMAIINKAKRNPRSNSSAALDSQKSTASRPGSTLRKLITSSLLVVKDLIRICEKEFKTKKSGKLNCADEFKGLRKHLQAGSVIVPTLRSLTVSLPESRAESEKDNEPHFAFEEEPVVMSDIEDDVLVMSSLMQPRRVSFVGSDGHEYRFLAKRENNGDMRKDSRLMEFVTVVNRLFAKDRQARSRNLKHKTYAVIPLTEQTGIIEWVNDLAPLRTLVREELTYLGPTPPSSEIASNYSLYKNKRKFLEEWAFVNLPPVLDKFFVRYFANGGDARKWLDARATWTHSVATWSMTGYIVGLGDRHAENILVEVTTGRAVHVDFAMLFDKGALLKVPEVVPFRLTPNMVGALGIAGTEGAFRVSCETALRVLRQNVDALMGTVESFVHDPLVELHRSSSSSSNNALETNAAVRNKLRGIVDGSGIALSVKGQVQKLITDATSNERLGAMYVWWSAWT